MVDKLYNLMNIIKMIGLTISGVALIGMMVFIVLDVMLRNAINYSISGGFEITQNYFMTLTVFPALSTGVLPKVDLLFERFSPKAKKRFVVAIVLIELVFLCIVTHFTWEYARMGWERKMAFPAAGKLYPVYPIYVLIPISFALIIVENLFILYRNLTQQHASFVFRGDA